MAQSANKYSDWDIFAQARALTEMSARPRHSSLARAAMHRGRVEPLSAAAHFPERRGLTGRAREAGSALPRRFVRVHCEPGRVSIAQVRALNPVFWPRQIFRRPEAHIGATFPACPSFDVKWQGPTGRREG